MEATVARRADIAAAAQQLAPAKRYWAIVGNGTNRIAAEELRIKLCELCYKSIACDATEDKKHIDLSCEPLILVCAAGLDGLDRRRRGQGGGDLPGPQGVADRDRHRRPGALRRRAARHRGARRPTRSSPSCSPRVAGHLFGYEAALAIDAQARPLREARAAIEDAVGEHARHRRRRAAALAAARAHRARRPGSSTACAAAPTTATSRRAPRCGWRRRYRYALGIAPLDAYQAEHGRIGTPAVVVDDLTAALTQGIEELTRPVDAIKHQAKTVTVGISRSDETLLQPPLVAGRARRRRRRATGSATRRCARWPTSIPPSPRSPGGSATSSTATPRSGEVPASIVDRGGIALDIPSRTERVRRAAGHEAHRRASSGRCSSPGAASDGRTVVIVPETKDDRATGLTLLHVRFHDRLPVAAARGVLQGYRNRWSALRDAVPETEPTFREDLLADGAGRRPARGADPRAGRPLAHVTGHVIGIGVDLVRGRPDAGGARAHADAARPRVHRRRAGVLRPAAATRPSATPPASPPRRRC